MVINFRRVNAITQSINFPIPEFDEILEKLNCAKLFITLDLAQGYLKIPISEEAKPKSAFITEDQTGQFERAMLGLANVPKVFAKLMKMLMGPLERKGLAFNYFDDTCVYAEDFVRDTELNIRWSRRDIHN